MAEPAGQKRKPKRSTRVDGNQFKKFKKQKVYHSDTESEEGEGTATGANASAVNLPVKELEANIAQQPLPVSVPDVGTDVNLDADANADAGVDADLIEGDAEADLGSVASEASASSKSDSGSETHGSSPDSESDDDPPDDDINLSSSSNDHPDQSTKRSKTKRHDPAAFASSISAILSSKLTTTNRTDPVLARSKDAATASHELAESKLETKARKKLRDEKRVAGERGRVRDVLLGDKPRGTSVESVRKVVSNGDGQAKGVSQGMSAAEITEQERRLRKTAQRGVVKLFNAVRASQVKSEEAAREAKQKGVVGVKRREEKVGEMGRQAFLDLVGSGKVDAV